MKKILIMLVVLFGLAHADEESAKVVFDLTTKNLVKFEKNIIKGVVINKSHYESSLKELDVTVVIHGGAYRFFVKDIDETIFKNDKKLVKVYAELKKRIASMAETYDVEFLMCGAAMKRNKLEAKDIVEFVKIIPNSTIGLIDKQNEGYAYLPVRD
ncbi:DsrE family protein [Sulfurimonas paralvinellae]|uniref:DsrE family protein n=1 Tax=Sulfurimonas paralvinellae TaxID=317658 RepID=A0A7M1B717_9BACT|nr:DsrE family protein [Sulfurimonas paralvinellae]QOP45494.1 DsrE family protein [Sulfurimonas paralvinellae]